MPEEIFSIEEFNLLLTSAIEVRMKRGPEVKLKIRTKNKLYTYKCDPIEAEKIWNGIRISKREI
ncbi:MAG: hypothetical protein ACXAC7_09355 [Candidatus Hodarchaeales archaeon]|jgi:hypothetical protein